MSLQKGSVGVGVLTLQRKLQRAGYGSFVPTGYYGDKTYNAVLTMQKNNGLPQTGVFAQLEASTLNRLVIYRVAVNSLGVDTSPNDFAPDEYGCADSVSGVLQSALGGEKGIDWAISTAILYRELLTSKAWCLVQSPLPGDIIISPTGYGNGGLANGHVGICATGDRIMSNSSLKGVWEQNFTTQTWKDRYVTLGGFPVYYFRKL